MESRWTANDRPAAVQAEDFRTTTKSYAEGDVLASIENVTGSRDGDVITGDGVPNVLKGGGGDDELVGGGEDDTLYGGEGDDLLGQTTGTPQGWTEDLNGDGDTVRDPGEDGQPAVAAITDDPGNDTMYGGPGDDMLYGGAGDDTLNGGPGDDDLTGDADVTILSSSPRMAWEVTSSSIFKRALAGEYCGIWRLLMDGTGDKIDLSAFNIDPDDLAGLLSERAGNVIVNLEDYGGGRITIRDD